MTGVTPVVSYTRLVPLNPPPPGWIWIQDIEKEYRLPGRSLYRWIQKGVLTKYRRIGDKRTYLDRAQLEKELQLHPVPPKEEGP